MGLPATIDASLSWPSYRNGRVGPFEVDGALYVVLWDSTSGDIEAWKSTDGGETWAEQDSAGAYTRLNVETLDCVLLNGTIYALYARFESGNLGYQVIKFDTATDSWGVNDGPLTISGPVHTTGLAVAHLAVRGDDNYVVLHQGAPEMIMGSEYRRVVYSRFESGTWTTEISVSPTGAEAHHDAQAILLGDTTNQRVHMFYSVSGAGIASKTLNSSNSLSASNTVDTNALGSAGLGTSFDDGGTTKVAIVAPTITGVPDSLSVYIADDADDPTWSLGRQAISDGLPESDNANPGSVAADGTTVYAFWFDDTDQDMYRDNDQGTSTWQTDVEHLNGITGQGISAAKVTDAIGIVYSDGGTVRYVKHSLKAFHVQSGSVTLDSLPKQVSVIGFDPDKTFLLFQSTTPEGATSDAFRVAGRVVDSTTIEFTTADQPENNIVTWWLIEHDDISVQRGTEDIAGASTSADVTINSVTTSRSLVTVNHYRTSNPDSSLMDEYVSAELTSSTNLRLRTDGKSVPYKTYWQVVELPAGALVQRGAQEPHGTVNIITETLATSVTIANSLLLFSLGGPNTTDDDRLQRVAWRGQITDVNEVTFTRRTGSGDSSAHPVDWYWEVAEWDGWSVQQVDFTLASATLTDDLTITSVDKSKAFVHGGLHAHTPLGRTSDADLHAANSANLSAEFVDSTTLRVTRDAAEIEMHYTLYVVELQDADAGGGDTTVSVPKASLSFSSYAPTIIADTSETVSVPKASLALTSYAPTITATANVTVSIPKSALTLTTYAPTVAATDNVTVSIPAASLSITAYAPAVIAPEIVTVPAASLALTAYAPSIDDSQSIAIPKASLSLSPYTPAVDDSQNIAVPLASLSITSYAPVVDAGASITVSVPKASLSLSSHTPTVDSPETIAVPLANLSLSAYAPAVNKAVVIPKASIALSSYAPAVNDSQTLAIPKASLALTSYAPTIATTANVSVAAPKASLTLAGHAPAIDDTQAIAIPAANLTLTSYAPIIDVGTNKTVAVPKASLSLATYAPAVDDSQSIVVPKASLSISAHTPTLAKSVAVPKASVTLTSRAPAVNDSQTIAVPKASLSLTSYAPTVGEAATIQVPKASPSLASYAPNINDSQTLAIPSSTLAITTYAPTLKKSVAVPKASLSLGSYAPNVDDTQSVAIPAASLSIVSYAPTIQTGENVTVSVPMASLALAGHAPSVDDTQTISVPRASVTLTSYTPKITATTHATVEVPKALLSLSSYAPNVDAPETVAIPKASASLTSHAPTINDSQTIAVPRTSLTLSSFAPVIDDSHIQVPPTASLSLTAYAPTLRKSIFVPLANLALTSRTPTIIAPINIAIPAASLSIASYAPTATGAKPAIIGGTADTNLAIAGSASHSNIVAGSATHSVNVAGTASENT